MQHKYKCAVQGQVSACCCSPKLVTEVSVREDNYKGEVAAVNDYFRCQK